MEDQRKRTLEALEQRFAQAEAEIRTQQQKSKKRPIQDKDKLASTIESSPANTATKKPFPNTSPWKAMQNGSKRSKKRTSLKQHKKIGSFDLPQVFSQCRSTRSSYSS